jgi:hypothetical protein
MFRRRCLVFLAGLGIVIAGAFSALLQPGAGAAPQSAASGTTAKVVAAAQAWLAVLDDTGRAKAQMAYEAPEKRTRWSNLPITMVPRNGVRMGDLNPRQREAAMAVLAAAFSADGYRKVVEIVRGDEILNATPRPGPGGPGRGPGPGRPMFGQDEYFLAFAGTPSTTAPWMLQFGGHHLAVNMTFGGARATLAPTLTGAQPATYSVESRTVRPLGRETDRAFALINALDEAQRSQAILGARVADLVLGPGQDGRTIQPEGLKVSAMNAAQQAMVMDIVTEWAGIAADALAAPRLEEIKAKLPQTWFAWSGPIAPGSVSYFRIQGPTLVIEFAPQRDVDHVHTIYRDPTNDYGSSYGAP